ncbi:MAG: substrate-binding domain-containing protein [Sphingomonadales bacterium]|nr:substrate-binding domain-containing protein [Sphingomonadales bacterium]
MTLKTVISAALLATTVATPAMARDEIRVVGSSTVYPFSTVVAENFGRRSGFATPVVEATGTGGGMKLFCSGVSEKSPDVSNASRAIKPSEIALCAKNGVKDIIEIKIGYDGIVLANALKAPTFELSTRDLYLALARKLPDGKGGMVENHNMTWNQVNAALPNTKIEVLGPPPTSGTRDAFVELVMDTGCATFPVMKALKKADKKKFQASCRAMREDGRFIEAGENDNLIVQKLNANPNALGIFGFSFLDQNSDKVKANPVNGTDATFDNIADGSYPVSRALYVYVKKAHIGMIKGLKEFVLEFVSEDAMGEEGYLSERGLIPLPEDEYEDVSSNVRAFNPMDVGKEMSGEK